MRNILSLKTKLKSKPLSRWKIRKYVENLKRQLNINNYCEVNIIQIFEHLSLLLGFKYEIVEDEELPNEYAETDIINNVIRIRSSVYERAYNGNPRDRFTIAHELGHFFLHSVSYSLARTIEEIKIYENPEWQANVFAGEFLVPTSHINNLTVIEVAKIYNVSKAVARIQLKESKKGPFF